MVFDGENERVGGEGEAVTFDCFQNVRKKELGSQSMAMVNDWLFISILKRKIN